MNINFFVPWCESFALVLVFRCGLQLQKQLQYKEKISISSDTNRGVGIIKRAMNNASLYDYLHLVNNLQEHISPITRTIANISIPKTHDDNVLLWINIHILPV